MKSIENTLVILLNNIYNKQKFIKIPDGHLNFFGNEVALVARELLYIVVEIEKQFSFNFSESDFIDPDFYTITGFIKKVEYHLS